MDRERANFTRTVDQIRSTFDLNPVVLFLPIGAEDSFRGVVDIARNKAWFFKTDGSGQVEEGEIPDEMIDDAANLRESLMEYVAETDDELIEKFLEEGELITAVRQVESLKIG